LSDVRTADYAGVVFVGGCGSKLLFHDQTALAIAIDIHRGGKVFGAICQATVAGTEAKTLTAQGATYTGPGVTVDGNIVTANGPKSSKAFGQALQALLSRGG
jgi:protease I